MDNSANMLQLCRLCLVKDEVNIPIFEEQGDIRQIFQKISSCLPVKVSQDDKLPKKICDGCSYKLDMCYEFWNTSANTEKQLLSWLSNLDVSEKLNDVQTPAGPQPAKPTDTDTIVKQEEIDPSDVQKEEEDDEEKGYMFQQNLEENNAGPSAAAAVAETNEDEPPPKRQRRTAAVKAAIAMDNDSDDDDDSGEPITKMEDESEDSDGDDNEPSYADVPSTSADDQPGPSGVGKDGADAPQEMYKLLQETTVINAWIVYNMVSDKKLRFQEFNQHAQNLVPQTGPVREYPMKRTHTFIKPHGPGKKRRKPCKGCYRILRQTMSSRKADNKVTRVTSYCDDCVGKPGYCLPCFNKLHY